MHPQIALLAKHLLELSPRFENTQIASQNFARDGLRCLGTLDALTHQSLPGLPGIPSLPGSPPAPVQQAAPAQAQTAAQAVRRPALPSATYGSQRTEYQGALGDNTIIQALLEYHSRIRPASAPLSGFRPQKPGTVAAQPKPTRPGTTRIFRSRDG